MSRVGSSSPSAPMAPPGGQLPAGTPDRAPGVVRVIELLRAHLEDPPTLQDMAQLAMQSPFHFIRKFRRSTGVPPRLFLSAIRLETAKRLLLTTDRSVTDVCFDVGYNSLGTFITRFTQYVGVPPRGLRRLASTLGPTACEGAAERGAPGSEAPGQVVAGEVPDDPCLNCCTIFVGLFTSAVPQGTPVACAILRAPGTYRLGPAPPGRYYVMAAAVPRAASGVRYVLCDAVLRGRAGPITLRDGTVSGDTTLVLRPPQITDPPIVVALPALLLRLTKARTRARLSAAGRVREAS